MTEQAPRILPPTADAIEARFRSPAVTIARPLLLGGIRTLGTVRRFWWEARDLERLADLDPPVILAANHASHTDTAAILGVLPARLRARTCVAAALDVFGPADAAGGATRRLRRECLQIVVAAAFHAFAFDRHGSSLRSMRTACDMVDRGWSLLLFPEGTRSRDGSIGQFKSGIAVLARRTGRPIVPVRVTGGSTILPCGATMPRAGRARVHFGAPLLPEAGESGDDFVRRLRDAVRGLAPDEAPVASPIVEGQVAGARY